MQEIQRYPFATLSAQLSSQYMEQCYFFVEKNTYEGFLVQPYRTESTGICFLKKGTLRLQAGLVWHEAQAPCLIAMGADVIRAWKGSEGSIEAEIIFFKSELLAHKARPQLFLDAFSFLHENDQHLLPLQEAEAYRSIEAFFNNIKYHLSFAHSHQKAIVAALVEALLLSIDSLHHRRQALTAKHHHHLPENCLAKRFMQQLSQHFQQEHQVNFYAEQLHLTPNYLSNYLKERIGKNASEWIQESLLLEAQVLLQEPENNIGDIARSLGFKDQAVFSKFYKRHTGISPLAQRRLQKQSLLANQAPQP
jgi:AraC-like DNA-binding protein